MSTTPTLAIVGASLAGAKAAEAARDAGFAGHIVLVGDEARLPYERPPLSKAVLRGEKDAGTARVHPEGFYDAHHIELVTDRVDTLDPAVRTIGLAGGQTINFDTAVLATGASPDASASPERTSVASTTSAPSTTRSDFATPSAPRPAWS